MLSRGPEEAMGTGAGTWPMAPTWPWAWAPVQGSWPEDLANRVAMAMAAGTGALGRMWPSAQAGTPPDHFTFGRFAVEWLTPQ